MLASPTIWTKNPQEFLNAGRDITQPSTSPEDPDNPSPPDYVTDTTPPDIIGTEDIGTGALRYGIPAVAAAVGAGPLALGLIGAGTELSAQQAEEGLHVPTVGNSLSAAFTGLAEYAGGKWLQPAFDILGNKIMNVGARVLNKIFVPKDFYKEPESAAARSLYSMLKGMGSSPTPGQVVDNDFTQFTEGMARGAMLGKKPVKELDKENARLFTDSAKDYIESHARLGWESTLFDENGALKDLSKVRFGQLANAVLTGKFNMMDKIMGRNYDVVREFAKEMPERVNTSPMTQVYKEFADNPAMQKVYNSVKAWIGTKEPGVEEIVSPVLDASGKTIVKQAGKAAKVTEDTDIIKAIEARKFLNKFLSNRALDEDRWAAGELKKALDPELRKTLGTNPQALEAFDYAQSTAKKFFTNLDNEVMGKLKNTWDTYPSTVLQTINGSTPKKYDVFMAMKKAYQTTSEGEATGSLAAFNRNVVEPIRYDIFKETIDAQGKLLGDKLESNLTHVGPDFGKEVFGGEEGWKSMLELARAAKAQAATTENVGNRTMYIKMAQGSAIAGLGMGAYGWSQDNTAAKISTIGIFLTPIMLSRYVVGNPELTRTVIDGMTSVVGSKKFNRAAAQITALGMKDATMTAGQALMYNVLPGTTYVAKEDQQEGVEQNLQFIPTDGAPPE
ncbi:MAG: hypothetical protein WC390_08535 [Sulfurimonas sp.]|jgi:hypothetical protein